ncbi:cadherin repeat domain-containing protein, partial [Veronia pacifica]|uniref:cadherin repeat domain-containing protein n=1 Tax=Veronia pacifica TaxID=1080227 RepID=UPI0015863C37
VSTLDDGEFEGDEDFTLTVATTIGGQTLNATGDATITEAQAIQSITGTTVEEGETLSFTVTLTNAPSTPTTFNIDLSGTALAGEDYGALTFSDGVTYDSVNKTITVPKDITSFTVTTPAIDNVFKEDKESVVLEIGNVSGTGFIVDEANPDAIIVTMTGDTEVTEGRDASYAVTLDVTDGQKAPPGSIITLTYTFSGGATEEDIIKTTQATVGADGKTFTFTVRADDDVLAEVGENYTVKVNDIKINGDTVYENLDTSAASVTTEIKDETGNNPVGPLRDINSDANKTFPNIKVNGAAVTDDPEKNVVGYEVGITLFASDPDGEGVTYSLLESANGLFKVDPGTGKVTLARKLTPSDLNNGETAFVKIKGQAKSEDGTTSEAEFNITISKDDWWLEYISPLIIDLNGDGVQTLNINEGVAFDIDADGKKEKVGWASAGDALLAIDLNGDGIINDGSELFGEASPKPEEVKDGFQALSFYDENQDGVFDANDSAYDDIIVWQDKNSDGISQADEMIGLAEAGVVSIDLTPEQSSHFNNGNFVGLQSTWTDENGDTHAIDDVWLQVDDSVDTNSIDLSSAASVSGTDEADRFILNAEQTSTQVTVNDFTVGEDHIDLSELLEEDQISSLLLEGDEDQVTVSIDVDGDEQADHEIVLDGVSLSELTEDGSVINTLFDSETTALITSDDANVVIDTASVLVEIEKELEA